MSDEPEFKPPHWSQFLGIDFKKAGILLAVLGVLGGGGWYGYQRFQQVKHGKLVAQAESFLAEKDHRSAALMARQVLKDHPYDLRATKVMAAVASEAGSPMALLWLERVSELEPGLENTLRLGSEALRQGDLHALDAALGKAGPQGAESARYHELAGSFALAARRLGQAAAHFREALRLDPGNDINRVNLAVLELQSGDREAVAAARRQLEQMTTNAAVRLEAARALVSDARRSGNYARGLEWQRILLTSGEAKLRDHLEQLTLMQLSKNRNLAETLRGLQMGVQRQPEPVALVLAWMHSHGYAGDALRWADALPPETGNSDSVRIATAECLVTLQDWKALKSRLQAQDWQGLDFLRLGFLSRVAREQKDLNGYARLWKQATDSIIGDAQRQSMLARMSAGWQWWPETEALWQTISLGDQGRMAALGALHKLYLQRKDEPMLLQTCERIYSTDSTDFAARNNLAQLSMLQGKNLKEAYRLAGLNYTQHPSNPVVISTQAFAFYQQKRPEEAVKLLETMPEELLKQPGLAAYYGLALEAAGRGREAKPYLDTAARASEELLPTEQRLVAEARKRIQ